MEYGRNTITSFDGRYRVDYWEDEVRMGCWIILPTITDLKTGHRLLSLEGNMCCDVRFHGGQIAVEATGTYTGGSFTLWLDADRGVAWFGDERDGEFAIDEADDRTHARAAELRWIPGAREAPALQSRPVLASDAIHDDPTPPDVASLTDRIFDRINRYGILALWLIAGGVALLLVGAGLASMLT